MSEFVIFEQREFGWAASFRVVRLALRTWLYGCTWLRGRIQGCSLKVRPPARRPQSDVSCDIHSYLYPRPEKFCRLHALPNRLFGYVLQAGSGTGMGMKGPPARRAKSEQLPNHRHWSLKAFEEHRFHYRVICMQLFWVRG